MTQMDINEIPASVAGFSWYKIPMDAELRMDVFKERILNAGLDAKLVPGTRSYTDALRLALNSIATEESKTDADGNSSRLIITNIPKGRGDTIQKWGVHQRLVSVTGQEVNYPLSGYVELHDNDTVVAPSGVIPGGAEAVAEKASHYIEYADHTKLRNCLGEIYDGISQIKIGTGAISLFSAKHIEYIREVIRPIFSDLDQGEISMSAYTLPNTPENNADMKIDIERSAGDQLQAIKSAILKARAGKGSVTAGIVKDWLTEIENLQSNLELMGILDVTLPYDLDDFENELLMLESEIATKPKKKRVIAAAMTVNED